MEVLKLILQAAPSTSDVVGVAKGISGNIKIDFGVIEPLSELDLAKERVIRLIKAYDTSGAVNSFTLEGKSMWLPNEKRISITDSINKEKASG